MKRQLQLAAIAVAVATTVGVGAPTASAAVDGSGIEPHHDGRIAFGRIMPGHERTDQFMALYAIDPDGTDEIQLTDGYSYGPAWSPDGTRLAYTLVADDGSSQIATVAADGSDVRVLTSGPGVHETPSWSPDGTWIAYGYSPILPWDAGFHTVLYRMDADGTNPTLIGDPDAFDYEPKISPDGTEVLFQRWLGDGQASPLLVTDLASGEQRTVMDSGGLNPAWSPDGSRIAMQTDPRGSGIWGPLITISADGDPASEVELYPGGAERGGFKPAYSPDGSHIAFGCGSGAGTDDYDEAICVVDADGGDSEVLVDTEDVWENEVSWGVAAPVSSAAEDFDGLVDVDGGRSLYLRCSGEGSPTVILEGGDEDTSSSYFFAEDALAAETRTCVYDRANLGRSDAAPGPRGLAELVGDLEQLLEVAEVPAPYVLVGTSGGGYITIGYAVAHPEQIAGMVFVETPAPFVDPPPEILEITAWDHPSNVERRDYLQVERDAWSVLTEIGDIPVVVISNDYGPDAAEGEQRNVEDQRALLELSPRAEQLVVTTGHAVEEQDPQLVIDTILETVAAAR